MKFINTQSEFGDIGPHEAASKEALADEMTELFASWAQEAWDDERETRELAIEHGEEWMPEDEWKRAHVDELRKNYVEGLVCLYSISDGNATEEGRWDEVMELAEEWYGYLAGQDGFPSDVETTADYSAVEDDDVEALNAAITAFENRLAEQLGHSAWHGHGSYSVSAGSEAGFNLTVEI